jgi:hypothetical protein
MGRPKRAIRPPFSAPIILQWPNRSAKFRAAMQQILFAAAKKWFTPQRGTSASLPADTADGKIGTFAIASLDVPRERVMLWGTKTDAHPGSRTSRFHRTRISIGVVPG